MDAVLGGESSGGLTVRDHIHGKDSIYAAALFVEMIAATGNQRFDHPVSKVSYEDGCKVYFADNSFVICCFSGTEASASNFRRE